METEVSEIKRYLSGLSNLKAIKKIYKMLDLLQILGLQKFLQSKDVIKLKTEKDLYELKTDYRKKHYRLFFIIKNNQYLFIHAYDKKRGEKTPQKEINTALSKI